MRKLWGVFLFVFFVYSVNAAILIDDDFNRNYNVGDAVELKFSLKDEGKVSGFVESYLRCDSDTVLVDKRWVFLEGDKKDFDLEFPLREVGDCQFRIEFLNDEAVSDEFYISDEIEIVYSLNDKYFFPGENVFVSGSLNKSNGDSYNGVVDFKLEGMTEKSFEVVSGDFNFTYEVKGDFVPGQYKMFLSIEEKDIGGAVLNSGVVEDFIFIKAEPTSISIDSIENVKPSLNVSLNVGLLDQVGNLMENETLVVRILNSNKSVVFQREVLSGEEFYFDFSSDFLRGSASVDANYGSLRNSKTIYVEDNRQVETSIFGNTLKITNIGNVYYDGSVGFEVEGNGVFDEFFVNVSLGVGEVYLHQFEYSGVYNISVGDDSFPGVYLTGAAISLDSDFNYKSIFIVFVFVFIFILCYIVFKKKFSGLNIKKNIFRKRFGFVAKKLDAGSGNYVVGEGVAVESFKENNSFLEQKKEEGEEDVKDLGVKVRKEKLVIKEDETKNVVDDKDVKKKVFMVFIRSEGAISEYEPIVSNFGFGLNRVDDKLGYVIFYQSKEIGPEYKVYNLAKALRKFSDSRNDTLSIVLNRGVFEKKLSILKKFAIFNKSILDMFPGKMVISNKIMSAIYVKVEKVEKIIEIMGRKIKVWIID
jgi:hypothetical protein